MDCFLEISIDNNPDHTYQTGQYFNTNNVNVRRV